MILLQHQLSSIHTKLLSSRDQCNQARTRDTCKALSTLPAATACNYLRYTNLSVVSGQRAEGGL
jgi:hypothetical protein